MNKILLSPISKTLNSRKVQAQWGKVSTAKLENLSLIPKDPYDEWRDLTSESTLTSTGEP